MRKLPGHLFLSGKMNASAAKKEKKTNKQTKVAK